LRVRESCFKGKKKKSVKKKEIQEESLSHTGKKNSKEWESLPSRGPTEEKKQTEAKGRRKVLVPPATSRGEQPTVFLALGGGKKPATCQKEAETKGGRTRVVHRAGVPM